MSVPTLPDTERLTSYTIVSPTTGPLSIGFDIYCDDDDLSSAAIEVWDDGAKLTAETDYTVSSATSGDLSILPRPITDGRITFTSSRSGAIKIVGARRPRRTAIFTNGQAVPVSTLNEVINDTLAIARELFDLKSRMLLTAPGTAGGTVSDLQASIPNPLTVGLGGTGAQTAIQALFNLGGVGRFATRTALKAADTATSTVALLTEAGREGVFYFRAGSFSTQIAADTLEGVYLKADAVAASAGAWVRVHNAGVYDVKWFGALGDNSTNDYAAIQGCIDFVELLLGGTVLFTKGGYVVNTGLVVDTALVRLQGVGCRYVSILSSVVNINLVTLNAARCAVTNLSLFNQVQGTSDSAVLTFGANAVQCTASDLDIVGGYQGIRVSSGSADNIFENIVARQTYGAAIVYCQGTGTPFFRRCIFNNDWPGAVPSSANDKGARGNTTAYVLNDFVTSGSFILQCLTAGTSGGAPPSLTGVKYGQAITDGTVTWYIANNNTASSVLIDTGCLYATFQECDFTGAFVQGALVKNGLAGTRPDLTRFINCTTAGMTLYGFLVQGADGVDIIGSDIRAPAANSSSTAGIYFDSNYVGDANVERNRINSSFDYGVRLGYSTSFGSAIVRGNMIFGLTKGVLVDAGVNDFQIVDNNLGTSSIWGSNTTAIDIASGAGDRYVIMGNRVNGATTGISDAGTGVNKTVQRSAQSAAFSAHKNASDQTGIADSTPTKLTFGTEVYDRGGYFATSTWTPPAGPVSMSAAVLLSGTWLAGALMAIMIYKNGSPLKQANWYAPVANNGSAFIQCDDVAAGTDTYEVYVYADVSASTATASGTVANTYFCGHTVTI